MKLAKMLIASFAVPFAIIGAGHFIARWLFGPTTPREDWLCILWGITGVIASGITVAVISTIGDRTDPSVLTRADTKTLNSATKDTLVDWYITLNCWGWPSELSGEEPKYGANSRRHALMQAIKNRVGDYAISHKWNTTSLNGFPPHMTEEQFQEWYLDPKGYAERRLAEALAKIPSAQPATPDTDQPPA